MVKILYPILDKAFSGLIILQDVNFGSILTVSILAVVLTLIITLIYKKFSNQEEIKSLKNRMKEIKKKMDSARKENNIEEMNKYLQESLEINNKIMFMNLKPMLITFLIVIFILPWLHYTFDKTLSFNDEFRFFNFRGNFTYEDNKLYLNGIELENGKVVDLNGKWEVKNVDFQNKKVRLSKVFIELPFSLPFVGKNIEWIGFYILISIPSSLLFRKLLDVH